MRSNSRARSNIQISEFASRFKIAYVTLAILPALLVVAQFSPVQAQGKLKVVSPPLPSPEQSFLAPQTYTHEGVSIEFSLEPVSSGTGASGKAPKGNDRNGTAGELLAGKR